MGSLGRRVMQDRERYKPGQLDQSRSPLDVERKPEEVGNRVPEATHYDVRIQMGRATLMACWGTLVLVRQERVLGAE